MTSKKKKKTEGAAKKDRVDDAVEEELDRRTLALAQLFRAIRKKKDEKMKAARPPLEKRTETV